MSSRAFLTSFSLAVVIAAQAQTYTIKDLGVLPGGTTSRSQGMNSLGHVVGMSTSSNGQRAFYWSNESGMVDLGNRPGGAGSCWGWGINNNEQVCGEASGIACIWSSGGNLQLLGNLPGGSGSYAHAINSAGHVAGLNYILPNFVPHGFFWTESGGMQDIGALPGYGQTNAIGMNDNDAVVGWSGAYPAGSANTRAFLWTPGGGMQNLGVLPGHGFSQAYGINSSGVVVGSSQLNSGNNPGDRAFIWTPAGGIQSLGVLPGATRSFARGINSSGQVVGDSDSLGDQAFLWTNSGGMVALSSLTDATGSTWQLAYGMAINDAGEIAGYGYKNSVMHAFLATLVADFAVDQDFSILSGKRISGGLQDIRTSDDQYLRINALQNMGGRRQKTEIVVGARSMMNSPNTITIKLESHASPAASDGEVALRNWATGQFETVQTFVINGSDSLLTVPGIPASLYRRADGRVEARIRSLNAGQFSIDLVLVELAV